MIRRHLLALAAAAAAWPPAARAADAPREINFGFISTESSTNLKTAWQPLLEDL